MPSNPRWTISVREPILGLLLAREANRVGFFTVDQLSLLDRSGNIETQTRSDSPLSLATISEDGSVLIAVTNTRQIRFLSSDLKLLWERELRHESLGVTVDPLGLFAAVSDVKSTVSIFDSTGERYQKIACPRPVVKLAFQPSRGHLICVGDLGWIGAYDLGKRDWAWRGTFFFNAAYLGIGAADSPILVGSFTDSLAAFTSDGKRLEWKFPLLPAREVQFTWDGQKIFLLTRDGTLRGFSIDGQELKDFETRMGVSHFRIDGFGKCHYLATGDGNLVAY